MKLVAGFVSGQKAGEALWPESQHVFLNTNVVCVQGHSERERNEMGANLPLMYCHFNAQ